MKKAISLILVIILSVLSFTSCKVLYWNDITRCPGYIYSTKDGSIWIEVCQEPIVLRDNPGPEDLKYEMIGKIVKDGIVYECFVDLFVSISYFRFFSAEIENDPRLKESELSYDEVQDITWDYILLAGYATFYSNRRFSFSADNGGFEQPLLFETGTTFEFYKTGTAN